MREGCIDNKAQCCCEFIKGKAQLSRVVSSPTPDLCPTTLCRDPGKEKDKKIDKGKEWRERKMNWK